MQSVPPQSVALVMRIPSVLYGAGKVNFPLAGRKAWICEAVHRVRTAVLSAFSMKPPGGCATAHQVDKRMPKAAATVSPRADEGPRKNPPCRTAAGTEAIKVRQDSFIGSPFLALAGAAIP